MGKRLYYGGTDEDPEPLWVGRTGLRLSVDALSKNQYRLRVRAGVQKERAGFHAARRSRVTSYHDGGATPSEITQEMGWTDEKTVLNYILPDLAKTKRKIRDITLKKEHPLQVQDDGNDANATTSQSKPVQPPKPALTKPTPPKTTIHPKPAVPKLQPPVQPERKSLKKHPSKIRAQPTPVKEKPSEPKAEPKIEHKTVIAVQEPAPEPEYDPFASLFAMKHITKSTDREAR